MSDFRTIHHSSMGSPNPSPRMGPYPSPTFPPLGPSQYHGNTTLGGEPVGNIVPIDLNRDTLYEEMFESAMEHIQANIRHNTHIVKRDARFYRIRENLAEALRFPGTQTFAKPADVSRAVIAHCRRHGQIEGEMCYFDDYLHALFGIEEAPMSNLPTLVKPYIYIDSIEKKKYCTAQLKDLRGLQGHLRYIHQEMNEMLGEVEDVIEAMEEKITGIERIL